MHHTIIQEAFGVRLRPVCLDDAAFIVSLRTNARAVGRIGDSATTTAAQEVWLQRYFERQNDYYFITETSRGTPIGTYGIYDIQGDSAELGRWIIQPGVPAALPSAIAITDIACDQLHLRELRGTVVADNRSVRSINRKLGWREIGMDQNSKMINGRAVDIVHLRLLAADWPEIRQKLGSLAEVAAGEMMAWSNSHDCE